MDPAAIEKAAAAVSQGGVSPAVIYVLAVFCMAVVIYVLKDYVSNHKSLVLALDGNTKAFDRNTRVLKRVEKRLNRIENGRSAGSSRIPGNPSSTSRERSLALRPIVASSGGTQ